MLQLSDLLKPHKKAFNTPYWPEVSMTFWNLKRLELACIVDTLGSTHAINVETQKEMLDMICPFSLPAYGSSESVNVISVFTIMRHVCEEEAETLSRPSLTQIHTGCTGYLIAIFSKGVNFPNYDRRRGTDMLCRISHACCDVDTLAPRVSNT